MSRVIPLTGATREGLPGCCLDCVFWQGLRGLSDQRRKTRWSRAVEERFGAWGRVLFDGDQFRGLLQYGPASDFPRAQALPAGPPGRDAGLLTCAFLAGSDPEGSCERLVLEALADLKARQFAGVEAFAFRHPEETPAAERFVGHHTLFDRDLLLRLGFRPVRARGRVILARLDLGGLAPAQASASERAAHLGPLLAPGMPRPA